MVSNKSKIVDILAPIDGENQCGQDLTFEYVMTEIRESRITDTDDPVGIWETERRVADWSKVENLCLDLLKNRSKDLQVLIWLSESWYNKYGWNGAIDVCELLPKFCAKFWDGLYPTSHEARANLFSWFMRNLAEAFKAIPLYPTDNTAFRDFEARLGPNFLGDVKNVRDRFVKSLAEVEELLDEKVHEAEGVDEILCKIITALEACSAKPREHDPVEEAHQHLIKQDFLEESQESQTESDTSALPDHDVHDLIISNVGDVLPSPEPQMTVDIAFDNLSELADFLENNLPQSPVPLLLRAAAKLRRKTFSDLMKNDSSGENVLMYVSRLMNAIDAPSETTSSPASMDHVTEQRPVSKTFPPFTQFGGSMFNG